MQHLSLQHSGFRGRRAVVGAIALVAVLSLVVLGPASPARGTGGTQLWEQRYGLRHEDMAVDLGVNPDGSLVYVTGSVYSRARGRDIATIAYDPATGAQVWIAMYGAKLYYDEPSALAVSPDGTAVYVTGDSVTAGTQYDYRTVAYDAKTGVRLWVARYNDPANGFDSANDVSVSMDGSRVYVTGGSGNASGTADVVTVAYDAATGARVWVARLDGPAGDWDGGQAVTSGPGGDTVFVTGYVTVRTFGPSYKPPKRRMVTIAYDAATGDTRWTRTYGGRGAGNALALSPDGSTLYVAGSGGGAGPGSSLAVVAYDAVTGTQNWVGRYKVRGDGYSFAKSVVVSPDGGRVYVGGQSSGAKGDHLVTLAYDQSGSELWRRTFTGKRDGLDSAGGMVVSPGGAWVYVAGTTEDHMTKYDYATLAYDAATGEQSWVTHYVGPVKYDNALAIGVSPDGSAVFVTGGSMGSGTGIDYETVAYSTS